jgi:hypothetical protein
MFNHFKKVTMKKVNLVRVGRAPPLCSNFVPTLLQQWQIDGRMSFEERNFQLVYFR